MRQLANLEHSYLGPQRPWLVTQTIKYYDNTLLRRMIKALSYVCHLLGHGPSRWHSYAIRTREYALVARVNLIRALCSIHGPGCAPRRRPLPARA